MQLDFMSSSSKSWASWLETIFCVQHTTSEKVQMIISNKDLIAWKDSAQIQRLIHWAATDDSQQLELRSK